MRTQRPPRRRPERRLHVPPLGQLEEQRSCGTQDGGRGFERLRIDVDRVEGADEGHGSEEGERARVIGDIATAVGRRFDDEAEGELALEHRRHRIAEPAEVGVDSRAILRPRRGVAEGDERGVGEALDHDNLDRLVFALARRRRLRRS